MCRLVGLLATLSFVLAVSAPVAAVAQENAGEDEYTEGLPGGSGETPTGEDPAGSDSGSSLPPSITSQFEDAGTDGAAAAALAEQGSQNAQADNGGQGNAAGADGSRDDTSDGGFVGTVKEVLIPETDSGLGIWLPIILGLALAVALVAGFARFRKSRTPA